MEPHQLATLRLPQILFWNLNHFLVLEGFERERAYLNDPAAGRRSVSAPEFDSSFSGVVLTFEPAAGFERGGQEPRLRHPLRIRLVGSEYALVYVVLASLLLAIPGAPVTTFPPVPVDA